MYYVLLFIEMLYKECRRYRKSDNHLKSPITISTTSIPSTPTYTAMLLLVIVKINGQIVIRNDYAMANQPLG